MKLKYLILAIVASMTLFAACQEREGDLSFPQIEISQTEAVAQMPASSFTVQLTSNRAWRATSDVSWIAIDPDSGEGSAQPQTVEITVQENTSWNRTGKVVFDIVYDSMTLAIAQDGNGSPEDYIIYSNDFDKETATQEYGSSKSSWPYLDQFEGWKNQKGVGVENISYAFSNVSARNNSNSNGSYSDYEGSGLNNLLFGSNGYLRINNLDLKGFTDFVLTFGSEKYLNDDKTALFNTSEMLIYASIDGEKWVPVTYEYNGTAAGRWNTAQGLFAVPEGTSTLSLYITATVASAYRLDDLQLSVSEIPATTLDFSQGGDLPTGGSGSGGGSSYENAPAKTVQEFITLADGSTYYKLTGTVSGFNPTYCSFDLTDDSGKIYVYSVDNKDEWSSKISNGGTVTLAGKYLYYSSKSQHEVVNAQILSFTAGSGDNPGGDYDKAPAKTVEEFIALADESNYYKLTGTVSGFNAAYCSFDLTDATGKIYVYSVDNKSDWSSKISNGGTVTLAGKYLYYSSKSQHEVVNAQILSFTAGSGDNPGGGGDTGDIKYEKMNPSSVKEGLYAIAYTTGGSTYLMKNAVKATYYVAAEAFDLSAGKAPSYDYLFTVKKSGSGYTIQNAAGTYVGVEVNGTHYNLKPALSSPYVWSFSAGTDGAIVAKGDNSGDYCMSYNASYTEYSMYNNTDTCPTFYLIDNAGDNPGGDTPGDNPGDNPGGGGNDGSTITWTVGAANQTWSAVTDPSLGAGFSATANGMTVSYFKSTSTTSPVEAKDDHIRVYKGSRFVITVAGSSHITGVELTCLSAGSTKYCYDLTLTDGSKAKANTDAMKVSWSGDTAKFEANAVDGQLRISSIKVTYK